MTTTMQLDGRVTDEAGRPVKTVSLHRSWFVIQRTDSQFGVTLTAQIPGYTARTTTHRVQAAAERAAQEIYDAYRAEVRALTTEEN